MFSVLSDTERFWEGLAGASSSSRNSGLDEEKSLVFFILKNFLLFSLSNQPWEA